MNSCRSKERKIIPLSRNFAPSRQPVFVLVFFFFLLSYHPINDHIGGSWPWCLIDVRREERGIDNSPPRSVEDPSLSPEHHKQDGFSNIATGRRTEPAVCGGDTPAQCIPLLDHRVLNQPHVVFSSFPADGELMPGIGFFSPSCVSPRSQLLA